MDYEKLKRNLSYLMINAQAILIELDQLQPQPKQLPKPIEFLVEEGGRWYKWFDQPKSNNFTAAHAIKFDDGSIFDMVNGWRVASQSPDSANQEKFNDGTNVPMIHHCRFCEKQSTVSEELIMHGPNCPFAIDAYGEHARRVPRYPEQNDVNKFVPNEQIKGRDYYQCSKCHSEFGLFENYKAHTCDGNYDKVSTDQRIVPRALLERLQATMQETYDIDKVCNSKEFYSLLCELDRTLATEKWKLKAPSTVVCKSWYNPHYSDGKCIKCGCHKDAHPI